MIRLDIPGRDPLTFNDLDSAMYGVFELFPRASFSLWNDNLQESWMDIYDGETRIGRFVELEETI